MTSIIFVLVSIDMVFQKLNEHSLEVESVRFGENFISTRQHAQHTHSYSSGIEK